MDPVCGRYYTPTLFVGLGDWGHNLVTSFLKEVILPYVQQQNRNEFPYCSVLTVRKTKPDLDSPYTIKSASLNLTDSSAEQQVTRAELPNALEAGLKYMIERVLHFELDPLDTEQRGGRLIVVGRASDPELQDLLFQVGELAHALLELRPLGLIRYALLNVATAANPGDKYSAPTASSSGFLVDFITELREKLQYGDCESPYHNVFLVSKRNDSGNFVSLQEIDESVALFLYLLTLSPIAHQIASEIRPYWGCQPLDTMFYSIGSVVFPLTPESARKNLCGKIAKLIVRDWVEGLSPTKTPSLLELPIDDEIYHQEIELILAPDCPLVRPALHDVPSPAPTSSKTEHAGGASPAADQEVLDSSPKSKAKDELPESASNEVLEKGPKSIRIPAPVYFFPGQPQETGLEGPLGLTSDFTEVEIPARLRLDELKTWLNGKLTACLKEANNSEAQLWLDVTKEVMGRLHCLLTHARYQYQRELARLEAMLKVLPPPPQGNVAPVRSFKWFRYASLSTLATIATLLSYAHTDDPLFLWIGGISFLLILSAWFFDRRIDYVMGKIPEGKYPRRERLENDCRAIRQNLLAIEKPLAEITEPLHDYVVAGEMLSVAQVAGLNERIDEAVKVEQQWSLFHRYVLDDEVVNVILKELNISTERLFQSFISSEARANAEQKLDPIDFLRQGPHVIVTRMMAYAEQMFKDLDAFSPAAIFDLIRRTDPTQMSKMVQDMIERSEPLMPLSKDGERKLIMMCPSDEIKQILADLHPAYKDFPIELASQEFAVCQLASGFSLEQLFPKLKDQKRQTS